MFESHEKEKKSDEQLKKIDNKKLRAKEVRVVEVKTCLEKYMFPKNFRESLIDWCYDSLKHRDKESMNRTIRNDFKWPAQAANIDRFASSCESCQNARQHVLKPWKDKKQAELWETMKIDLAVPQKTTFKSSDKSKSTETEVFPETIVDEGASIVEMWLIKERSAVSIARVTDIVRFCEHITPKRCAHEYGGEL